MTTKANPSVHPRKNRPTMKILCPTKLEGALGQIETRNESCRYISRGYRRMGIKEGFLMIPPSGAMVALLFPEYRSLCQSTTSD